MCPVRYEVWQGVQIYPRSCVTYWKSPFYLIERLSCGIRGETIHSIPQCSHIGFRIFPRLKQNVLDFNNAIDAQPAYIETPPELADIRLCFVYIWHNIGAMLGDSMIGGAEDVSRSWPCRYGSDSFPLRPVWNPRVEGERLAGSRSVEKIESITSIHKRRSISDNHGLERLCVVGLE